MDVFAILSVLSFLGLIVIAYLLKKTKEEYESKIEKMRAVLKRIYFELNVQKIFESQSIRSLKEMSQLGKKVFEILKAKLGLEDITTFSEMKEKIKEMDLDEFEKETIIEFLDNMILLEYAPKEINKKKKEEIRDSIVNAFKMASTLR